MALPLCQLGPVLGPGKTEMRSFLPLVISVYYSIIEVHIYRIGLWYESGTMGTEGRQQTKARKGLRSTLQKYCVLKFRKRSRILKFRKRELTFLPRIYEVQKNMISH